MRLLRPSLGLGLALLTMSVASARAEFRWSEIQSSAVDAFVARRMLGPSVAPGPVPSSLALAVDINGQVVLAKGFGAAAPGLPAGPATVYHIGSLSKQMTAAAILSLIEGGATAPAYTAPLELDTPVRLLFGGVEAWEPAGQRTMTVRSLLTMTSNLPNFTRRPPPAADPWGMIAAPRLLDELKKLSPSGWPGSFEYSNTSYFLLAEIAEAVAGGSRPERNGYKDYLRQLFARAGLKSTGFVGDYAPGSEVAAPSYRRRPAFTQRDWLKGSGDVASNVLDLAAWNAALMAGAIVSEPMRELMFSEAARVTPTLFYGMGWFVTAKDGLEEFSHSGSVPGYTSFNIIVRTPDHRSWASVTILTNADGVEGLDELADDIVLAARDDVH